MITPPASFQAAEAWRLMLPKMAAQPLQLALEDLNFLWQWHRPQLVSLAPHMSGAVSRASEYHCPIVPSQDGLPYTFEHRLACSAASQTITVGVDYCTTYAGAGTAWTALYSTAVGTSATAGGLTTVQHGPYTLPASAVVLRFTYSSPAAGTRTDHHILGYPTPAAATAGIQASGFVPFDDGLLTHADGGAVHTEWLNRLKASSVAVLRDRHQMALSFAQEFSTTPFASRTDKTAWWPMPAGKVRLPWQTGTINLRVMAIGGVSGGATADLLRVGQLGGPGQSVLLAADGTVSSATLQCIVQGQGADAHVVLQPAYRTTTGNTTRPFTVVALYQPGT